MRFSSKINRIMGWIFTLTFVWILGLNLFFDGIDYRGNPNFVLPNAVTFLIGLVVFGIYLFVKVRKDLTRKKFWILLAVIFVIVLFLQLLVQKFAAFETDWDVKVMRDAVDSVLKHEPYNTWYFSIYPNNLFLFFIMIVVKMVIPGEVGLLVLNSILVSLAGLFTCLAVRNFTGSYKKGLCSYLITIPLILLSPWILIPYSDTFALLFPILIVYLYSCKKKTLFHYFAIPFLSIIGYLIKPTVLIVLIAIVIVEAVNNLGVLKKLKKLDYKRAAKYTACIMLGVGLAFGIREIGIRAIHFEPAAGAYEFNMTHFLAMGQNDETNGTYYHPDVEYSNLNGMGNNLGKFKDRLFGRTLAGNFKFFVKKNLINYNNGAFAWGHEGVFYYDVPESESKVTDILRSFLYSNGKNYKYYAQILQIIWITVLMFCPFMVRRKNLKKELVVMMTIVGITLFLLLFEARSRYLYLYAPVFVLCAITGAGNLKRFLLNIREKSRRRDCLKKIES